MGICSINIKSESNMTIPLFEAHNGHPDIVSMFQDEFTEYTAECSSIDGEDAVIVTLFDGKIVVATVEFTTRTYGKWVLIYSVDVREKYQRKGIYKRMLTCIVKYCKRYLRGKGVKSSPGQRNEASDAFWEAMVEKGIAKSRVIPGDGTVYTME
jgi:GNAT superfamily N-acetyltransferase